MPQAPVPRGTGLDLIPRTQREVLLQLKEGEPLTATQLAGALRLSPSATRQVLQALERLDLVEWQRRPSLGGGRPTHAYTLTARGQELFPSLEVRALQALAATFERSDPGTLALAVGELVAALPGATGGTVQGFLAANGFMPAAIVEAGHVEVHLTHCPLWALACSSRTICEAELGTIARLAGSAVVRIAHRLEGDTDCAYRFPE